MWAMRKNHFCFPAFWFACQTRETKPEKKCGSCGPTRRWRQGVFNTHPFAPRFAVESGCAQPHTRAGYFIASSSYWRESTHRNQTRKHCGEKCASLLVEKIRLNKARGDTCHLLTHAEKMRQVKQPCSFICTIFVFKWIGTFCSDRVRNARFFLFMLCFSCLMFIKSIRVWILSHK